MTTAKKILIVEDEQYLRELYIEVLQNAGFNVDSAADGQEGYLAIYKGGYDLVLLDIMLPKMDGLTILKKLKDSTPPKNPNKAIVMLTNLSQDINPKQCAKYGAKGYLIKSDLTPGQLVEEVKKFLLK